MKKTEHTRWYNIFLRKRKAKEEEETLVSRYYQKLEKEDLLPQHETGFNRKKVYGRVISGIDEMYASRKNIKRRWLAAATILVCIAIPAVIFQHRIAMLGNIIAPVTQLEKSTRNGEVATVLLADGSKIWLNSGSKLSYPDKFRGNTREVTLSGEAYFEIAKNPSSTFIIHTDALTTQVLGTSFNINAYNGSSNVVIAVLSGKIRIAAGNGLSSGQAAEYLERNQQIVYNRSQQQLTRHDNIDAATTAAWKDGKMIYRQTLLTEVTAALQRKFNIAITVDDNLSGCSISCDFSNEPVARIMNVLAELVNGEVIRNGNNYHIKGSGC